MQTHSSKSLPIWGLSLGGLGICIVLVGCQSAVLSDQSINTTDFTPTITRPTITQINHNTMQLTSSAFHHLDLIPSKYTCDGENIPPPLFISDVPDNTKSLAVVVDDPDAPGGDWVHWLVWDLNPQLVEIDSDKLPQAAVVGLNDFGQQSWGGPCPPSGTHRYQFTLYAVDTLLALENTTTKPQLLTALKGHILDQTMLVGLYKRR